MVNVKTLKAIQNALVLLEQEIAKGKNGEPTVAPARQLNLCKRQLENMTADLNSGNPSYQYIGMGRFILDQWPYEAELSKVLLDSEAAYKGA